MRVSMLASVPIRRLMAFRVPGAITTRMLGASEASRGGIARVQKRESSTIRSNVESKRECDVESFFCLPSLFFLLLLSLSL